MPSVKCLLGTCDLQPQASQVALYTGQQTQTSCGMGKLFFWETVPTNLPGSFLFDFPPSLFLLTLPCFCQPPAVGEEHLMGFSWKASPGSSSGMGFLAFLLGHFLWCHSNPHQLDFGVLMTSDTLIPETSPTAAPFQWMVLISRDPIERRDPTDVRDLLDVGVDERPYRYSQAGQQGAIAFPHSLVPPQNPAEVFKQKDNGTSFLRSLGGLVNIALTGSIQKPLALVSARSG